MLNIGTILQSLDKSILLSVYIPIAIKVLYFSWKIPPFCFGTGKK